MTFVVPFDGSSLATAALRRAAASGDVLDEDVVAVSVVRKNDKRYAREKGWLDADEPFDLDTVLDRLRADITEVAPSATFEHAVVRRYATASEVAQALRAAARAADATVVYLGSANAGRIVSSLASVGTNVATDTAYDVYIVRSSRPVRNPVLRAAAEGVLTEQSNPD